MNAAARTARQTIKTRATANRATAKARRTVAAAAAATMKTHLLARGLDLDLAKRFAGAVTRKAGEPTGTVTVAQKKGPRCGRAVRVVAVKLFTAGQVDRALSVYRPAKDVAAQRAFLALAA